jgi:hypothetical protein
MNSADAIKFSFFKIHFDLILLARTSKPYNSYGVLMFAFLFYPIRATCPAHLVVFDLVTQIIFAYEEIWGSSSLCSFLPSLGTPSLLNRRIFFSTPSLTLFEIYVLNLNGNRMQISSAEEVVHCAKLERYSAVSILKVSDFLLLQQYDFIDCSRQGLAIRNNRRGVRTRPNKLGGRGGRLRQLFCSSTNSVSGVPLGPILLSSRHQRAVT